MSCSAAWLAKPLEPCRAKLACMHAGCNLRWWCCSLWVLPATCQLGGLPGR